MTQRPNEIKSGRFLLYPHYEDFVIECDGGTLEASPAEADQLVTMLAGVSGMRNFKSLPPVVMDKPFSIKLNEEGVCKLARDFESDGVSFPIYNIEELVDGIQKVIRKIQDEKGLRGGAGSGYGIKTPEPPIDGR